MDISRKFFMYIHECLFNYYIFMMVYFFCVFFYLCIFLFGRDDQRLKKTFKIKKHPNEFIDLNEIFSQS